MGDIDVARAADEIWSARRAGRTLDPASVLGAIDLPTAYRVQGQLVARRLADGERLVGWKLGYTSAVMREQMGIDRPNFGPLTDTMLLTSGASTAAHLVQPRVEPEVAVRIGAAIGGSATRDEVAAAIASAHACLEVVHSTWTDYRFTLEQNTADNSSAGQVVVGPELPAGDLAEIEVVIDDDGVELGRGRGADAFGHPLDAVGWLVGQLAARGAQLRAGDVVLTGGLTKAWPLAPGHRLTARFALPGGAPVDVAVHRRAPLAS